MTTQPFLYWPKVVNPNILLPQMTSDTLQPRFFFGGSQVPTSLEGTILGSSIKQTKQTSNYRTSIPKDNISTTLKNNKKAVQYTNLNKHHNIMIPKKF